MGGLVLDPDSIGGGRVTGMPFVSAIEDQLDGDYPNLYPTRPNANALRSTADYHRSLLDQHHDSGSNDWKKHELADTQRDGDTPPKCTRASKWDKTRHEQTNTSKFGHPGLTQQDLEEFESLPLAIRRKVSRYFLFISFVPR